MLLRIEGRSACRVGWGLAAVLVLPVASRAGDDPAASLAAAARESIAAYQPVSPERLAAAEQRLRRSVRQLEQALRRQPSVEAGWRSYLQWDSWAAPLRLDRPLDADDLPRLREGLQRLRTNAKGLELSAFQDAAAALQSYLDIAPWGLAAQLRDTTPEYRRLLESAALQLERHGEAPTTETAWKIGRTLGVVEALGIAADWVGQTRRRYAAKNVFLHVSEDLANRVATRPVANQRPVRDVILGTRITGTADTRGTVTYRFLPSGEQIVLEARLAAAAHSRTTGYNGPVKIGSTGTTSLSAAQRLLLSDARFAASPVEATASTRTQIRSIDKLGGKFGQRIIEKAAWKRARQQQRQAEQIAAAHARQRLEREFADEVARALAQGRDNYEQRVRAPLLRRDFLPTDWQFWSSAGMARVAATFASDSQLAADGGPPPFRVDGDLTVQLHESAVANYLPLALAGVTLRQETPDQPPQLTGFAPAWLKQGLREGERRLRQARGASSADESREFRPWSLTLNAEAPVAVRFDDGRVTFRVRTSTLQSEEATYENWDFLVSYDISRRPTGVHLRRSGPIEVFPTGFDPRWDERMSSQKSGFRSTLSKNLNARAEAGEGFPAEIELPSLEWGEGPHLVLQDLRCDDGWLTLQWQLAERASSAAPRVLAVSR